MLGLARSSRRLALQQKQRFTRRQMSVLEGDTGTTGTKVHHAMTLSLAGLAPLYFLTPDAYTDGYISKTFGVLLSANITAHSWIGLNYVCRDYVPKVSAKLLGPARVATLGFSVIMLLGMVKISVGSPGGLKGLIKGLWTAKPKKEREDF
jgi:CybS, succinate dehydrogenase cytochrome B small subunit